MGILKMTTSTKEKIVSILEAAGVSYSAQYIGITSNPFGETSKKPVFMDRWEITFSRDGKVFNLDYFTGMGLRKKPAKKWIDPKPVAPAAADVLYSVVLDAQACEESFEDWAADFGYDTDSRRALETYLECQKNGNQYLRIIGQKERKQIAEILSDY